ncbi:RICIN domain-containing protein [Eubacteriales bacterium OttesenSCG-928-G02]|nr:RICIN domain-containing protein [Eubacteriales bacterium OttesenSCG-928-G02]
MDNHYHKQAIPFTASSNGYLKWNFQYLYSSGSSHYYTIGSGGTYMLNATSSSATGFSNYSNNVIPDSAKWKVFLSNGKVVVQNLQYGTYLYQSSDTAGFTLTSSINSNGKNNWRIINVNNYVNLSSFTVQNKVLYMGDNPVQLAVTHASATFTNWSDFTFSSSSRVTIDSNGKATAVSVGTATITATHKPTGKTASFNIVVSADGTYIEDSIYYFKNVWTDKYLNVSGTAANTINVNVADFNDIPAHQWEIEQQSDGTYKIMSVLNNHYNLDVAGGSNTSETNIQIYGNNNSASQRWKIYVNTDETYFIMPAIFSTRVLEVSSSNNVQLGSYVQTYPAQKWVITPIDPFHPENIDYIRITKIPDPESDFILSVLKSNLCKSTYFLIRDEANKFSGEFIIDSYLKNTLEQNLNNYHNYISPTLAATDEERAAYNSYAAVMNLVNSGYISSYSNEYYDAWAFMYMERMEFSMWLNGIFYMTMAAYGVYMTATSYYLSYLSTSTPYIVSSSEYKNIAAAIDDLEDALYGIPYNNKTIISAEQRNSTLAQGGYTAPLPYKPQTPVAQYQQTGSTQHVRVFTDNNKFGKWMMKYSDIQGLTPLQIQNKFALPNTPTHYCFVTVPPSTKLYVGVVNQSSVSGTLQYELITNIPETAFGINILLP